VYLNGLENMRQKSTENLISIFSFYIGGHTLASVNNYTCTYNKNTINYALLLIQHVSAA
jgi:hypothetical protein